MKKIFITAVLMSAVILITGCKTIPPEPTEKPVITESPTPAPTPEPTPIPTPTQEKPYYIEVLPSPVEKEYIINPYSFIHSFYSLVFYDFRITDIISIEDRKYIMNKVYTGIGSGAQVSFVIKKYLGVDKLSFVFFVHSNTHEMTLQLKTNYDEGAGVLVPLEIPKEEWKHCVSAIYNLIDLKLVHKKNMYSFIKEETLLEERQFVNLAHLYIFDEKEENDSQVEEILQNIIKQNSGNEKSLIASLELSYFYLLNNRVNDTDSVINNATSLLEGEKMAELKWKYILVGEEMEILKVFLE